MGNTVGSLVSARLDVRGWKMDEEIGSLRLVEYNQINDPKF